MKHLTKEKAAAIIFASLIAGCAADRPPVRQGDLGVLDGDLLQKVAIETIPAGADCSRTIRSNRGADGWSTSIFLETTSFDVFCSFANTPQKLSIRSTVLTEDFEEYRNVSTLSSFIFGGPLTAAVNAGTSSSNEYLFRRFPPIAHVVFPQSHETSREETLQTARKNWETQRARWAKECADGLVPEHLLCRTTVLDFMQAADIENVGRQFDQHKASQANALDNP